MTASDVRVTSRGVQPGDEPLVSVLVPAFEYPQGVQRILVALQSSGPRCEVIVFDDSSGDGVADIVRKYGEAGLELKYQRNSERRGAVANWNALLDAARGQYCVLMHHDEFPIGPDFGARLIRILERAPELDVLMLECLLTRDTRPRYWHHVPMWLRTPVVVRWPGFVFRRNVVGPTAALVVRRTIYPRFDASLKWLVDVDLYYRLFRAKPRVRSCSELAVGSVVDRGTSITAGLQPFLRDIASRERLCLAAKHPAARTWCESGLQGPASNVAARAIEACLWSAMRTVTRAAAFVRPPIIVEREARQMAGRVAP